MPFTFLGVCVNLLLSPQNSCLGDFGGGGGFSYFTRRDSQEWLALWSGRKFVVVAAPDALSAVCMATLHALGRTWHSKSFSDVREKKNCWGFD